jgi:hypothetical protein
MLLNVISMMTYSSFDSFLTNHHDFRDKILMSMLGSVRFSSKDDVLLV